MPERISIARAAKQFDVSRRTIERWIRDGLLAAEASKHDRRVRLVSPAEVEALVAERVRPKTNNGGEELTDQGMIDTALQLIYSHHHRFMSQIYPPAFKLLTLEQLRQGPLGQDLKTLVEIARGKRRMPKKRALAAVESILQLLFWPVAADDYFVPFDFWYTDLGRLLGQVKRQTYHPNELMSIETAARAFGVTRLTIYRWLEDRTLDVVPDDATGRLLVGRRSVEHLKRVAAEFSAQGREEEDADDDAARPVAALAG